MMFRKPTSAALFFLIMSFLVPGIVTASGEHDGNNSEHKGAKPWIANEKDGSIMVYIPGGIFVMGSPTGDSDERPAHRVKLKPFYIDQFEITNIQYRKFVDETNYVRPLYYDDPHFNKDLQPVTGVSWEDAQAYAKWAGKRLPTEAEWEMAARSIDGREYPWGNFWFKDRCNHSQSGYNRVVRVGMYPEGVSLYEVYDMAGNVWEWCLDSYSKNYYKQKVEDNPTGPKTGNDKVLRGGGWGYDEVHMRSSNRFWDDKEARTRHFGFRCVRNEK